MPIDIFSLLSFHFLRKKQHIVGLGFFFAMRSHVIQRDGICLIYDRHEGIELASQNVKVGWTPPCAHYRYCLRHMANNFNEKYRNKVLKDLVYKARSQHQPRKFKLSWRNYIS